MTRFWRIFWYRVDQAYPVIAGAVAFALFLKFGADVARWGTENDLKLENTYAPAAGIFAVITGFLASFYGSIQPIADTRLKRISRTGLFKTFVWRIKEATVAGFLVSLLSLPYIIAAPAAFGGSATTRFFVAFWLGISVYVTAAFLRVGSLLFFVFEHQPPEDQSAG